LCVGETRARVEHDDAEAESSAPPTTDDVGEDDDDAVDDAADDDDDAVVTIGIDAARASRVSAFASMSTASISSLESIVSYVVDVALYCAVIVATSGFDEVLLKKKKKKRHHKNDFFFFFFFFFSRNTNIPHETSIITFQNKLNTTFLIDRQQERGLRNRDLLRAAHSAGLGLL
jgi:hypothetical protein